MKLKVLKTETPNEFRDYVDNKLVQGVTSLDEFSMMLRSVLADEKNYVEVEIKDIEIEE